MPLIPFQKTLISKYTTVLCIHPLSLLYCCSYDVYILFSYTVLDVILLALWLFICETYRTSSCGNEYRLIHVPFLFHICIFVYLIIYSEKWGQTTDAAINIIEVTSVSLRWPVWTLWKQIMDCHYPPELSASIPPHPHPLAHGLL